MNALDASRLARELRHLHAGPVRAHEPLWRYTTFRMGGPADLSLWPRDLDGLRSSMDFLAARGVPTLLIGSGSHLLVPDGGFRGVVVHTSTLSGIRVDGNEIWAEAGVTLRSLARQAMRSGLGGLEFAADIPGRVGASVAMNAGAYGASLGQRLRQAWVLRPGTDSPTAIGASECGFAAPHASTLLATGATVLAASFQLQPADRADIRTRMSALARRRHERQPQGWPTFGCMFANPAGAHASALLDAAGLKGARLGDAQISEVHANFVLNLGHVRYGDVVQLMDLARARVLALHGIALAPEVRILPES